MKQLKSIFNDVKHWLTALNAKRVLIIIIVSVLTVTPTLMAIGYVIYSEYLHYESASSVTLYTDKNELIVFDDGSDSSQTLASVSNIFIQLTENPQAADITPPSNGEYIIASVTQNGVTSELKCYFSVDSEEGCYTDSNGQVFVISKELNSRFLSTEYAEPFYASAACHELLTIDGDTVLPTSTEWYYKNVSGSFSKASSNKLSDNQKIYEITGALDIFFPIEPDSCNVQVFQGDTRIYSGNEKELASLTVDSKDVLRVIAEASWLNTESSENYGNITYDFFVHIKNRSAFYISSDEVHSGCFILLDCTNITDISKIKFESSNSQVNPVFRNYNGDVRALIVFPKSDSAETFEFSVAYGASSQKFTVNVLPTEISGEYSYGEIPFDFESAPDTVNKNIENFLFSTPLPQNEIIYFRGNFLDPSQNGFSLAYTHNSTVKWGEALEYSYTALGNEYTVSSEDMGGASVKAVQNGIISRVGNSDELGNYIVIDHGCGLRTWYAGLENADVRAGDIVLVGQHIGKTGKGTFNDTEGFRLFCTVYDTMIDPNTLWQS